MLSLLNETGAAFIFDTNHSLSEDNVSFLQNMIQHGYCPVSLHISDYDYVDERHDLPGNGVNDWKKLLTMLRDGGGQGDLRFMKYDIRYRQSVRFPLEEIADNIALLINGDIK